MGNSRISYSITKLPAQDLPATHAAFLEIVDQLGNYRGIELGRSFRSETEAQTAVDNDKRSRTDWRTATEIDSGLSANTTTGASK